LLGCGNIGGTIARGLQSGGYGFSVSAVYDVDIKKADALAKNLSPRPAVCMDAGELISFRGVDLVIEAASQDAVRQYGKRVLEGGKSIMVLSVGAFAEEGLLQEMHRAADERGVKVYIPSGAIAGIDGLKSGVEGGIDSVTLTTRKSPGSLGVDVKEETVLYDGPAREGIKKYPKNVNVAATLSLAGVGLDKTRLRIIADPKAKTNTHHVEVVGAFGRFTMMLDNVPCKDNPKTSYLAVLSALATLRRMHNVVEIGT